MFYTSVFRDGVGDSFVPHEVVERVSAAANAPTYGFLDQYLGRGIVGGNLYSISTHGEETAKLALRLLTGTEAGLRFMRCQYKNFFLTGDSCSDGELPSQSYLQAAKFDSMN